MITTLEKEKKMSTIPNKKTEKPEGCSFCDYPTPELTYYEPPSGYKNDAWICDVCERTVPAPMIHNSEGHTQSRIMIQASYIANMVMSSKAVLNTEYLEQFTTKQLVEELSKREGVNRLSYPDPSESCVVFNGPVIILLITD